MIERSYLLAKVRRSLSRDRELPLGLKVRKAVRYITGTALARFRLRACSVLGVRLRVVGTPAIDNRGSIVIGDDFSLNSSFACVQLSSAPGGLVEIGDDVRINFGSLVAAQTSVRIGDHVQIGPYCIVADTETPNPAPNGMVSDVRPVVIGDHVWLAARVTILPGVTIGAGTTVTAGSIVFDSLPAGVIAGGIPARVLRNAASRPDSGDPESAPVGSVRPLQSAPTLTEVSRTNAPVSIARPTLRGIAISDFTVDDLSRQLVGSTDEPRVECEVAAFGQVTQTLLGLAGRAEDERPDFAVVWTRPESSSPSFRALTSFEPVDIEAILADVDAFCRLVIDAAAGVRFVLVPTWVGQSFNRGLGLLDMTPGRGIAHALMQMNLRLAERMADVPNVHVIDAQRWLTSAAGEACSPKLWYMGKIPFGETVFSEAARDIKAALVGLTGGARKLLVLDLDDTLWGGIVGDVGWENLRLGGHDSVGEAYADFQHHIRNLKHRGVVIGLASKNEESVALDAIRLHPEMVLKLDDFVGWKISWNDKAQNIAELAADLNLGLESVVFIDDNPFERARVREALPEVFVPEWPDDKLLYSAALLSLRCFDAPGISSEDVRRAEMYVEERQRDDTRRKISSVDDWLSTLGMRVRVEPLNPTTLARTTQLLNKTNQMNMATRRMSESEMLEWASGDDHSVWTFSVSDRFGDAGLSGILSLQIAPDEARIADLVLSCRVMGRGIEQAMLHVAVEAARAAGVERVVATYMPSAKNGPCLEFLRSCRFEADATQHTFRWKTSRSYPCPESVAVQLQLADR